MSSPVLHRIDDARATEILATSLGGQVGDDALAELVRLDVLAWGGRARHLILGALSAHSGETTPFPRGEALLDRLIRIGDILEGAASILWPAPVRVITMPSRGSLLLGTIPTTAVLAAMGANSVVGGAPRRLSSALPPEALETLTASLGGVLLDVVSWAGVDREPSSVRTLDDVVERASRSLSSELDDPTTWLEPRVFSLKEPPALEPAYWKSGSIDSANTLVRGKRDGYDIWGWTVSHRTSIRVLRVGKDEAARLAFGWLFRQGTPARIEVRHMPLGGVHVRLPRRLPSAEYRLLSNLGATVGDDARMLSLDDAAWSLIEPILIERLHVQVVETDFPLPATAQQAAL